MRVEIESRGESTPSYATEGSAGMDLQALTDGRIILAPGKRILIKTGVKIKIPVGYEAQIRPRSGLAYKFGITVLNAPGTIDSDYRGDVGVILINHGEDNFIIDNGDRIAQMVVCKHERVDWLPVKLLSEDTDRGSGGFGSTGTK